MKDLVRDGLMGRPSFEEVKKTPLSDRTGKRVAIVQSNYIPWKGYFDMIAAVDEFVLYDDVQFTKNDWRNRNKIKTRGGVRWLSIPVRQVKLDQTIGETRISDGRWPIKHWKTLEHNYSQAKNFNTYAAYIEDIYREAYGMELLSDINLLFIRSLCSLLEIKAKITSITDYAPMGDRVARLVSVCSQAGADAYLSGPAAKSYLDESLFAVAGIGVVWMDYSGYPTYDQRFPPFEHGVTILDLLFNTGHQHKAYLKRF
jgi:hypothetical protein